MKLPSLNAPRRALAAVVTLLVVMSCGKVLPPSGLRMQELIDSHARCDDMRSEADAARVERLKLTREIEGILAEVARLDSLLVEARKLSAAPENGL